MTNKNLPQRIVDAAAAETLARLDLTSSVDHPGEGGRAREMVIREYIQKFIPGTFGVDTGFVIDRHGASSKQIDIVIYRSDYYPVLEVGGVKHFLVESVAAVLENKARISSIDTLHIALDNIASVKKLDRTGGGENYQVADFLVKGPAVDASNPQHQVWGVIVAQQSLTPKKFLSALSDWLGGKHYNLWPNLYVDVRKYAMYYVTAGERDSERSLSLWPHDSVMFGVTDPENDSCAPPLVDLALLLAERLRTAAPIDYRPAHYIQGSRAVRHGVIYSKGLDDAPELG